MPVLKHARVRLDRLRQREFAANTAKLGMGQGVRLLIQAVYFVLIARSLGPKQYGAFLAMTSLVSIVAPFAGFGSQMMLMKNVARDRKLLALYWGNGLLTVAVSGSLLTLGILALCPFFLGRELLFLTLLVCLSDLLLVRVAELAAFAFAAIGRMGRSAKLNVYITATRLIGIVLIRAFVRHPDVRDWTIAYLLGSLACFLYAFISITVVARAIEVRPRLAWSTLPESSLFAVSQCSATIYNDIDKTMLGKLASFTATGIYGAAYRIIDVSLVPVRAMLSAAYPEFFRRGLDGPTATRKYAYMLIRRSAPFGALVTVGLLLGAPLIPRILGHHYLPAVEALRWLAVIPLLRCVHIFLADGLTGAGYQGIRTLVQVGVGILNIGLNIYFIRAWSWRGAAWSSIVCDATLALGLWLVFQRITTNRAALVEVESCLT